jgi:Transposase IS66 family
MDAVTESELGQLKAWLSSDPTGMPESLRHILGRILVQYIWLLKTTARAKGTLRALREAMGFIPKSENGRQTISDGSGDSNQEINSTYADLKRKRDRAIHQKAYYQGRMRRLQGEVDTVKLQPSPEHESPRETMFTSDLGGSKVEDKKERVNRELHGMSKKGLHSSYDQVKRVDLELRVTNLNIRVESVTDLKTGKHVRASLDHIGPAGFQFTWQAFSSLIKMVVGFAIPINRAAAMIGDPQFGPSQIYRALEFAAKMLVPIYLHLAEALGDCDILSGDDSPTRVIQAANVGLKPPDPSKPRIHEKIDEVLGWNLKLASGKGEKRRLNVSLIMGKTVFNDARSTIAFFRSHFGSVGNIITKILESRRPNKGPVTIQGDLSPSNLPSREIRDKFDVKIAGCAAHARRPFWRWREDDEDLCYFMLNCFLSLSLLEDKIDQLGRTTENTLRLRQKYGRWLWQAIRNRAIAAMTGIPATPSCLPRIHGLKPFKWAPDSHLYKACAYIVNNYDSLTAYLDDARLESTNNRRERGLRSEKAMLVTSKFRKTRNGRAVLDVLRTINASCTMAKVDLKDYLIEVYRASDDIHLNPHRYTPYAVACRKVSGSKAEPATAH